MTPSTSDPGKRGQRLAAGVALACALGSGPVRAAPPLYADVTDPPLYGMKDGRVYLRDPRDVIRLYPHARLDLDAQGFFGPGVDTLSSSDAGVDLATRFFVRHARFELAGEILERAGFDVGMDLVADPTIDGARATGAPRVALTDAWVNLEAGRGLTVMIGVFQAPFSIENRTDTSDLPMMERNVAIRGFAVPGGKALGASIGGSAQHERAHWDVGFFGAESTTPGALERHFDAMGRMYLRPWAGDRRSPFRDAQLGASGRVGTRLQRDVHDDAPAVNSGHGFALWAPTRTDARGRTIHVIPSDLQWAAGLELRVPMGGVVLRSEAYWVSRNTREAVEGFARTHTERLGRLAGVGWYAELSWWPFRTFGLIAGDPPRLGEHPRTEHLELARVVPPPERYGVELAIVGAGVNASYDGASRAGVRDPSAPAAAIELYQIGAGVNYWHTTRLRLSSGANIYVTPGSGTARNLAAVPANLGPARPGGRGHYLVEVGARATVMF